MKRAHLIMAVTNVAVVIDVTCRHISSRQRRSQRRPRYQHQQMKVLPHLAQVTSTVGSFRVTSPILPKLTVGSTRLGLPLLLSVDLMAVVNITSEWTARDSMFSRPLRMFRGKNWLLLPGIALVEVPRRVLGNHPRHLVAHRPQAVGPQ